MQLSNLYAEKIFSEHPIALWTLDEEFDEHYSENSFEPEEISGILIDGITNGLRAGMYGSSESYGWYLGDDVKYYADNAGVPMVFGASNVTGLYPYAGQSSLSAQILPSLIVPAFGFLNNDGKYKDFTLEAWLRIAANVQNNPFRIIGPIGSTDGIYIDKTHISLKINNFVKSHFIDDWDRPMLIDFSVSKNGASLLINGERVISMTFDMSKVSLPNSEQDGLSTDWIGFYLASDSVSLMDIDCIAIYPFIVSETIAKRRFAYGQAVEYPQNLLANYGGASAVIDYSFANYSKNYNYPQIGKWSNGDLNNLIATGDILSSPNYQLPRIVSFKNGVEIDVDTFSRDLTMLQDNADTPYITFLTSEDSDGGYIKFESLNILTGALKAILGFFELDGTLSDTDQSLIKIQNNYNNDYVEILLHKSNSTNAQAIMKSFHAGTETTLDTFGSIAVADEYFAVGFDIDVMSDALASSDMSDFFSNLENLSLYVAGSEKADSQYSSKINSFSLLNADSYSKISESITEHTDNGMLLDKSTEITGFIGSYTLMPKWFNDVIVLDIGIDASWQDFVPLSFMQKRVDDGSYALEFMQINFAHPSVIDFDSEQQSITPDSSFRAYASFQPSDSYIYQNFDTTEPIPINSVVKPSGTEWNAKKYEILDNIIIYPPQNTSLDNLSLVLRFDFVIDGIITNPLKLKSLQVASIALNKDSDTFVGTRLGQNFKIYNNSDGDNPFRIYKESSPYLYMNNKSGIQLVGDFSTDMDRGLALIVNPSKSRDFYLSSLQMFLKYNKYEMLDSLEPLFEIKNKKAGAEHIKFYLVATNPEKTRGEIKAYLVNLDNTESLLNSSLINYSIDGHALSGNPEIELNEWHILSISFPQLLEFSDSDSYTINLTGPALINNISYFRVGSDTVSQKTKKVDWSYIDENPTQRTWQYWKDLGDTWSDVLYESFDDIAGIYPDAIYNIYLGTNKIVVDTDTSPRTLRFKDASYSVYDSVQWEPIVIKPV